MFTTLEARALVASVRMAQVWQDPALAQASMRAAAAAEDMGALSVLDQCLSFGEGVLSAARVRQALGLMDDESFGAVLAAIADRIDIVRDHSVTVPAAGTRGGVR